MDLHDYIITGIIVGIIIFQVIVFLGNIKKIANYKRTIEQAKNFEIIEVQIPEDRIKNIEVKEILSNPAAFRDSSINFNTEDFVDEVNFEEDLVDSVENNQKGIEYDEEILSKENNLVSEETNPEELNFPEEEFTQEHEIEEFEEDDFIFEDEKDSKSK